MMFTLAVSMSAAGPALSAPRLKMGALLRDCVSVSAHHFLARGDQVKPFSKLIQPIFLKKYRNQHSLYQGGRNCAPCMVVCVADTMSMWVR